MSAIITVGASMEGSVSHHNLHILRYEKYISGWNEKTYDEITIVEPVYSQRPIYCTGHNVFGVQGTGIEKFKVQGRNVSVVGNEGITNCPCDGKGYTNKVGSQKFKINGVPVIRNGDATDIHGHGTGKMTGGITKFNILY